MTIWHLAAGAFMGLGTSYLLLGSGEPWRLKARPVRSRKHGPR